MNDEQQLWRDFQKFMNQFPGLVAVAKKIGQIGDLEAWQAAEQRKLEAITQEIEKQRQSLNSERNAVYADTANKVKESQAKLAANTEAMDKHQEAVHALSDKLLADSKTEADRIVAAAEGKAREITSVVVPKKTALEAEIAALSDKLLSIKKEYESVVGTLAAAKDQHAAFIRQIVGTGG